MTKNKTKKQVSSDPKNNENSNFEEHKVEEVVSEEESEVSEAAEEEGE